MLIFITTHFLKCFDRLNVAVSLLTRHLTPRLTRHLTGGNFTKKNVSGGKVGQAVGKYVS